MLIQVPEYFVKDKKILKSSTLSCLYYFNREVTTKVNIQLNQHLLLHVFNGSKNIYTEDNVYTITSKQSVFISKGQYFMSEVLSVDTSYFDGIMVFFDDAFLFSMWNKYKKIVNKKNADKNTINSLCIVEESLALHETMLSTQMYLQRETEESLLIQLKFEEIFLQLLQSNHSNEIIEYFGNLYSNSIFKFKNLFENNDFSTVKEMMVASKLSEVQFRNIFYDLYRRAPKEWLLKRSLLKAKSLLENQSFTITEVSMRCGFNSVSWFGQSFKKEFGLTPKRYQQNC